MTFLDLFLLSISDVFKYSECHLDVYNYCYLQVTNIASLNDLLSTYDVSPLNELIFFLEICAEQFKKNLIPVLRSRSVSKCHATFLERSQYKKLEGAKAYILTAQTVAL